MRIRHVLHELLFICLIVFAVTEILDISPEDLGIVKVLISLALSGYLLYHVSITRILFNSRQRRYDILIILSFFFFAFKTFSYSVVYSELQYLSFLKLFLYRHMMLNEIMFYSGTVLILAISVLLGRIHYEQQSLMGVIRNAQKKRKPLDILIDTILIYFILMFFSYFIFTIVMEWFSIAIDAIIITAAIAYYLVSVYILRTSRGYKPFVDFVVDVGDEFVTMFLELFHRRETVYFGISGLVVIPAIIDLGNFIIPYIVNLKKAYYLSSLSAEGHLPVVSIFLKDIASAHSVFSMAGIGFAYLQNIMAIFMLLLIPFYIWISIFRKKHVYFSRLAMALFFSAMVCFISAPVFGIGMIRDRTITGVDITTSGIGDAAGIEITAAMSVLWFVIVYMLTGSAWFRTRIEELAIAVSLFFLGKYIYYFYSSTLNYYISYIQYLAVNSRHLLAVYFILYLVIITLFYISGFILFVMEIMQSEHVSFLDFGMNLQKEIMLAWSFLLFLGFIYLINQADILPLVIGLIASTILSVVLFRYEKDAARYILIVNLVLDAFFLTNIISIFAGLAVQALELVSRLLLLAGLSAIILSFRRIPWRGKFSPVKALAAAMLGIAFGAWFVFLREPRPALLSSSMLYIAGFSILIALNEEIIFRHLILGSALRNYPKAVSVAVQAVFFSMFHLVSFSFLLRYYGGMGLLLLLASLLAHGIMMGILAMEKDRTTSPLYPVISHAITVIILNMA